MEAAETNLSARPQQIVVGGGSNDAVPPLTHEKTAGPEVCGLAP